jgi:tRNA(fMet)-specific endonuclease VapC
MLDTDIMSYLMKKNHPSHKALMQKILEKEEGTIALSVISVSEISEGIENIADESRKKILLIAMEYILSSLVVLEFNDEAAWVYGKIRNNLRKSGQDIGVMDTLIAAHAKSQDLILVTNNSKHFERIQDIRIENWI